MPVFYPYRALGYITDGTPFSVVRRKDEYTIVVSVGKAWQIYSSAKLSLVFVGPQLDKKIRALAAKFNSTFAAYGKNIGVFARNRQVDTWTGHTARVTHLLLLGKHLLSVGEDRRVLIWHTGRAGGLDGEIQLPDSLTPSCIMHPDTYLNKIVIGYEEGCLQLWNISSKKMIYEFKGWGSAVRCIVSSPALDVVGVGCSDGRVHLHNLKFDETLMTLTHTTKGPVTSLSFRTDGQPLLAAGGSSGVITIWNLEKRKLQSVIRDAHDGMISSLYFLVNEPVLLSSAVDNSIKMWIFDSDDGDARLLRFRSGHSAPPSCMQYYGEGRRILSAGQDRSFRMFSTMQDHQSRELSQGRLARRAKKYRVKEEELKLTRVVAFAAADVRERDWCNVVTCHEDDSAAYTWRLQNFVIGEHVLKPPLPTGKPSPVTAAAISACGNFAVIGNAAGRIDRFNLQSGLHRGVFAVGDVVEHAKAHDKAVMGIECDGCNKFLISAGYEGRIKIWNFKKQSLLNDIDVTVPVLRMKFHTGNGLAVAVCDDMILRVYDIANARLVRSFEGHTDRITDACFSADGRWLLSSSMDSTLRIFDVVASRPLDTMKVDVPVTALSLSTTMDLLATTHVNRNGIYLWANQLMYSGVQAVEIEGSGKKIAVAGMPTVSTGLLTEEDAIVGGGEEEGNTRDVQSPLLIGEAGGRDGNMSNNDVNGQSQLLQSQGTLTQQLDPELVTLAMLPRAQWQGLVNLDIIKMRNKPIAPPKKPERAPFFLPTLPSLAGEPVFVAASDEQNDKHGEATDMEMALSRVRKEGGRDARRSAFSMLLYRGAELDDYSELTARLQSMSPAAIDAEVRTMEVMEDADGSLDESQVREVGMVLDFLIRETESNSRFELIQAFMQLFLKVHGEAIAGRVDLQDKARTLLDRQTRAWQRLDCLFQSVRCSVSFLSNSQL